MTDTAPAGWYPTAPNSAERRYWDGVAWTDFYYPPRPGQQLTAVQEAEQAARQAVANASETNQASARKPRRKRTVIIAGAVALAVAAAAVIVAVSGGAGIFSPQPKLVNGYEYLPAIHVTPTQTITLPAKYKFDAKVKALNPRGDGVLPGYTDKVLGVYNNPEFTSDAQAWVTPDSSRGTVDIIPLEDNDAAFADTTENEKDYGGGTLSGVIAAKSHLNRPQPTKDYQSWGLFDTYYIVAHYSSTGVKLKHPTVTPMIPSGATLATPHVTLTPTKGNPGSITFHWNKVKGATQYVILSYSDSIEVENVVTIEGITGASHTTWDSSATTETASYLGLTLAVQQNVGLETYGDFSADEEQTGSFNQYPTNHMLYGVMALRGGEKNSTFKKEYSTIGAVDSAVAAALPSGYAHTAQNKAFPGLVYTSVDQVPLLFPYTSLDGSTRQTRGILKVGFSPLVNGTYNLMLQGAGVTLGVGVRIAANIDPNAFIAAYNAKSLAAAPKTGLSSLPVLASNVTAGGTGQVSHSAPDLGYPVFGNDAFTKYLAANMIAHKTAVDISKFSSDDLGAIVNEAELQNPYVFDLTGYGLSSDNSTIYFGYGYDAADTTKLQQSVQAKVKSVVASTTTSSMSAAEKVTALNNWVTAHVTYNDAALAASVGRFTTGGYPKGFESAWDPDGALLDGSAVCGGYAAAFDVLANAAGVKTIVVTGNVQVGGRHAWNKVDIDGAWKDVDTTWNDTSYQPNSYLLINDDQFTGSATRSEDSVWMPTQAQSQYATAK